MGLFRNNKDDEVKPFSVKPQLKKMYGRNYILISQIAKNTKALEDIATELKKMNEKMDRMLDK